MLDELNRLPATRLGAVHFGFPYCIGAQSPDLPSANFDCATAAAPALPLPTGSRPAALAAYTSDAIPRFTDNLLLVLNGDYNSSRIINVIVVLVTLDENGDPTGYEVIMPEATSPTFPALSVEALNLQGSGFWPQRPLSITVSPEGWVYVSVTSGRIFVLRPK
jgi:glucose/arabinose dehydrogenase